MAAFALLLITVKERLRARPSARPIGNRSERVGWVQRDGTEAMTEFFKPILDGSVPVSTFQVNEAAYTWKK